MMADKRKGRKKMCMKRKFIVYYEVNAQQAASEGRKSFTFQQKNAMIKFNEK